MDTGERIAAIACRVLEDEVGALAGERCDVVWMEQGLHNDPDRLRREVQAAVDGAEADPAIGTVVLIYGVCSRGTAGIRTRRCPLVLPRAHDCITLLLGDRHRYRREIDEHAGTYWYSPGWNASHTPPGPERIALLQASYAERFDPEDVQFLMEQEQGWLAKYNRAAFVELGCGAVQRESDSTRRCADHLGWAFEHISGDRSLLRDLLNGPWDDERFLVMPPGRSYRLSNDERVVDHDDA